MKNCFICAETAHWKCGGCERAFYCGTSCARQDWGVGHFCLLKEKKRLCNTLEALETALEASPLTPLLLERIAQYRVSQSDIENCLETVVRLGNVLAGPRIEKIEGKGYGLVATRNYSENDFITEYGGEIVHSSRARGDYLLDVSKDMAIDGHYGFTLAQKGRWANEATVTAARDLGRASNAFFRKTRGKEGIQILALRAIAAGEEITIHYGDKYYRPWFKRQEPSLVIEEPRKKRPTRRFNP